MCQKGERDGKYLFFSGPCGCGKTSLANAYAKQFVNKFEKKQVYLIHGDDYHEGFVEADNKDNYFADGQAADVILWKDILKLNWECILMVARKVLDRGHLFDNTGKSIQELVELENQLFQYEM